MPEMTDNLAPLWRRMAVRLANISLVHPNVLDCEHKMQNALADELAGVLGAAQALLDTMETCHICKGALLLQESPVHCEDCSADCEGHDESECESTQMKHTRLRAELSRLLKG